MITGVIPEEPAVTPSETAGSGVWCGSVLADADACGVAFRVAMDAHFASHSDRLPCPSPERFASNASRSEGVNGRRVRTVVREPGVN